MKKHIFTLTVMTLLLFAGIAESLAGYCLVTTQSDSSSNGGSLRYKISKVYSNDAGSNCTPPDSDPGDDDYFDQVIIFATEEAGYANDVNEIILRSALTLSNAKKTLVIGNWSGDIASTDDVTYEADYLEALATAGDYGNVVIDASGLDSGTNPFECEEGTYDVYFRNLTIKLNGISEEDFWSDCRKNAGDVTIESDVEGGKDGEPDDDCDNLEICDGLDNDCDGSIDEGLTTITYYLDADGDGYGLDDNTTTDCALPSGYASYGGDCDDSNVDINPSITEVCDDGIDNNCDGATDPTDFCTSDTEVGYCSDTLDNDGDGYTDCDDTDDCAADSACAATTTETICDDDTDNDGDGYTDCEDSDCDANTDACPVSENDCDDLLDDDGDGGIDCDDSDCSLSPSCGTDNDHDGVTVEDGDCDDTDATIYPGAGELCGSCTDDSDVSTCTSDAIDQDCDLKIDEGCSGSPNVDDDGDGLSENAGDCDDTKEEINPSAIEICDNDTDDDCDGTDVSTESEEYLDGTLICDISEPEGSSASAGCGCDLTTRRPDSQTLSFLVLLMLSGLAGMGVVRKKTV